MRFLSEYYLLVGLIIGFRHDQWPLFEEGELLSFVKPSAAMIVFGGTFGAALISFPGSIVAQLPKMILKTFVNKTESTVEISNVLARLAERARREGLLALEEETPKIENHLLRKGVMLVVDGTDPDLVRAYWKPISPYDSVKRKTGLDCLKRWAAMRRQWAS